uniref:Uncharacterized protein n=1 Tax=Rhizophora mucronata TaxID=61149 RepID=A0A2P2QY06_RHIMU
MVDMALIVYRNFTISLPSSPTAKRRIKKKCNLFHLLHSICIHAM